MATRFVDLNEAAKMLGITPEELVEKRSSGDIHGYRDGGSWKFKAEEVERYRSELLEGKPESSLRFDDGLDDFIKPEGLLDDDDESILVSEDSVGQSPETTSSTIIGKSGGASPADSDLKISGESDLSIKPDVGSELSLDELGSEISLDAGSSKKGSAIDSDVALVPGVGSDTDVKLVADAGSDRALKTPSGIGADVLGDSEFKLKTGSSIVGPAGTGTAKTLGSGKVDSADLDIALDSELALSDDDEMVIGGSGTGSDLALNPEDSGISLATPTDSGLSLEADSGISLQSPTDSGLNLEEEPLDMGGSSISSLELPEDESIELDSGAFDAEPAQNLKKDEDFLLTPSDEMFTDESDSGSQVIALEDSVAFDQDAAALGGPLLADTAGLDQQLDALGGGGVAATPIGMQAPVYAGGPPEAPYSFWNIAGLVMVLMFFSLTGVLLSDMVRNMWAWEEGMDVATSISEGVTAAFGMK
jgi:excisionase family DNA binding protein